MNKGKGGDVLLDDQALSKLAEPETFGGISTAPLIERPTSTDDDEDGDEGSSDDLLSGLEDADEEPGDEEEGDEESSEEGEEEGEEEDETSAKKNMQKPGTSSKGKAAEPIIAGLNESGLKGLESAFRSVLGQEIKLPRKGDAQDLIETLAKTLATPMRPEVQEYQDALEQGMTPDQYWQQRAGQQELLGLKDDVEFMRRIYKSKFGKSEANPDGWDDTKIDSVIKKRQDSGNLEFDAEEKRIELRKQQAERQSKYSTAKQPPTAEQLAKAASQREALTSAFVDQVKTKKLYGIDLSKVGDEAKLKQVLLSYITPDETGRTKLQRTLSSNDNWFRMALLVHAGEQGLIEGAMHDAKNREKLLMLKALSKSASKGGGGQKKGVGSNAAGRLSESETFI